MINGRLTIGNLITEREQKRSNNFEWLNFLGNQGKIYQMSSNKILWTNYWTEHQIEGQQKRLNIFEWLDSSGNQGKHLTNEFQQDFVD